MVHQTNVAHFLDSDMTCAPRRGLRCTVSFNITVIIIIIIMLAMGVSGLSVFVSSTTGQDGDACGMSAELPCLTISKGSHGIVFSPVMLQFQSVMHLT